MRGLTGAQGSSFLRYLRSKFLNLFMNTVIFSTFWSFVTRNHNSYLSDHYQHSQHSYLVKRLAFVVCLLCWHNAVDNHGNNSVHISCYSSMRQEHTEHNNLYLRYMASVTHRLKFVDVFSSLQTHRHTLTHSRIHSLTHSLTYSLTRSLTHSVIQSFTHSSTHWKTGGPLMSTCA